MKKMGEVCKSLGISRKMLRDYDEMGLVHPTAKTDSGYALYDDDAIIKLQEVLIFREVGFSRLEIKKIFNHPQTLRQSYDMLRSELIEKRDRINGMILAVDYLKAFRISNQTLTTLIEIMIKYGKNVPQISFTERTNEMINRLSQIEYDNEIELVNEEVASSVEAFLLLSAVGLMKELDAESNQVQCVVEESYKKMFENPKVSNLFSTEEERLSSFQEIVSEVYGDHANNPLNWNLGEGSADYVLMATNIFACNAKKHL